MISLIKKLFSSIIDSVKEQFQDYKELQEKQQFFNDEKEINNQISTKFIDENNNLIVASISYNNFRFNPILVRYNPLTDHIELNQGPNTITINYDLLMSIEDVIYSGVDLKHS